MTQTAEATAVKEGKKENCPGELWADGPEQELLELGLLKPWGGVTKPRNTVGVDNGPPSSNWKMFSMQFQQETVKEDCTLCND